MRVRSADITPRIALVTTDTDLWLLFQRGLLSEDVEEELDDILGDIQLAETGD
jgi:hypothetical protein